MPEDRAKERVFHPTEKLYDNRQPHDESDKEVERVGIVTSSKRDSVRDRPDAERDYRGEPVVKGVLEAAKGTSGPGAGYPSLMM